MAGSSFGKLFSVAALLGDTNSSGVPRHPLPAPYFGPFGPMPSPFAAFLGAAAAGLAPPFWPHAPPAPHFSHLFAPHLTSGFNFGLPPAPAATAAPPSDFPLARNLLAMGAGRNQQEQPLDLKTSSFDSNGSKKRACESAENGDHDRSTSDVDGENKSVESFPPRKRSKKEERLKDQAVKSKED